MASGSFGCRVVAGRQHISPRALQFASRAIAQGARHCTGSVCPAQGDRVAKALYEFATGRAIGQMLLDVCTVRDWQFKIHEVRKQGQDISATLRRVFHAEEPAPDWEFLTSVGRNRRADHGFDSGRVEHGVVDQTRLDCPQNTGLMLRVEARNRDLDPKLSQPCRQRGLLRADLHFQAAVWKRPCLHILSGVETGAGSQGNQQVFGRRHAAVRSAIVGRLVADHAVTPRAGFELHVSEVLNCDFHKSFQHERCRLAPKVTGTEKSDSGVGRRVTFR